MKEYRGNVAMAVVEERRRGTRQSKQPRTERAHGLTTGEKLLYLLSVVVCVALASVILSKYAELTALNLSSQQMDRQIRELQETNQQLEIQQKQLSSDERIREYAEQKGMKRVKSYKMLPVPGQSSAAQQQKPANHEG
ncbi:cell division protein FtsL [Polycladomyces subterraneus]|uniref:Cell division protein FtsL n=1 Tax=Polycladomyces subterraneus TaxID=1016997 RepID=A0ABT8IRE2_9BACL|nr:cell division protein FtsL [Polycladomyces subterraneus]MDN4594962.1 cell division protein FtsL [Polycladomyces subterraneus]